MVQRNSPKGNIKYIKMNKKNPTSYQHVWSGANAVLES